MIVKENQNNKEMHKDLYKLFMDFIQFECNKLALIVSAKFYCFHHGLEGNVEFLKFVKEACNKCKSNFVEYLINHFEEVSETTNPALDVEFKDAIEAFTELAALEDKAYEKLNAIAEKAIEVNDVEALAFILPMIKNNDHLACRALEAIKNDQCPSKLIQCKCCGNYI